MTFIGPLGYDPDWYDNGYGSENFKRKIKEDQQKWHWEGIFWKPIKIRGKLPEKLKKHLDHAHKEMRICYNGRYWFQYKWWALKYEFMIREYLDESISRSRERSKTFPGIAKAMAEQWG